MLQRMLDLISSTKNFMRVYVSSTCMCNEYKIPKKKQTLHKFANYLKMACEYRYLVEHTKLSSYM